MARSDSGGERVAVGGGDCGMGMNAPWGYRIDRPVAMGHRWKHVQIGSVVKVQPVCGCMHPIHELQVAWADEPIKNPCGVCAEW